MAILKCKMCGGDIILSEDRTCGTCDCCGSTMTFPRVSDEQRLNLFNRANHYRRQNDFDKAISAYEKILELDDTDAEAHWGAVLSRYGIEYVEDPVTHERIPTCHRVQPTSLLTDLDYLAALEHAPDEASRRLYQEEGERIAEIQKGILAISAQEEPYDVFICYKETTDAGSRTRDSALAQEIYYQLVNEGYKVFFSRITLEDKLGRAYEPYIFAALNSAKVMLVVGTKPEHFSAVWVRNEWSRYLALMREDRSRLLIPCYRDMDPYDLPEELSALQSQDMAKIGFMQDLIRGVKKVLDAKAPAEKAAPAATQVPAAPGVVSLLTRAAIFLEDGDWESAAEYAERVLDIDPKCAAAYIVKVCVDRKQNREADLAGLPAPIGEDPDYQKALRFASGAEKARYESYDKAIRDRIQQENNEQNYKFAASVLAGASSERDYRSAAGAFGRVSGYRDADQQRAYCLQKAEEARIEQERKDEEKRRIREQQEAAARLERERQEEQERIAAEKRKKRLRKIVPIVALVLVILIGALFLNSKVIQPNRMYSAAKAALEAGQYDEATALFTKLDGYKDAAEQALESQYQKAEALREAGDYAGAYSVYVTIAGYKDVDDIIETDDNIAAAAAAARAEDLAQCEVGKTVRFGHYEQDNNASNGVEEIEWLVLANDGATATLISRYALDCVQYNTSFTSVTWETCSLRKWLNGTFLNAAFSAEEQAQLATATVTADANPKYSTNPGNATQDKVFLLSIAEVNKYFSSDSARVCTPTAYAEKQGVSTNSSGACWWRLRSPGDGSNFAANVINDGSVYYGGANVNYDFDAVRPVVVLRLSD